MRGGDDVGSRVRVASAACLVSSGLFVAGISGAVALADPDNSVDGAATGAAGRTTDESTDHPRRGAPPAVGTATGPGAGSPGRRSAVPPPRIAGSSGPSDSTDEGDLSKRAERAAKADETLPGGASGEQTDAEDEDLTAGEDDIIDDGDVDDDEEDECGWGWWPLPPHNGSSTPFHGDGGGATAASPPARPAVLPGLEVATEPEVPSESPELLPTPDPQDPLPGQIAPAAIPALSMPVIALPPAVPGIGGGDVGGGPSSSEPANAGQPPAPERTPAAQPPAAPRTDTVLPVSYRAGYGEYLRTAGMPQVIAVAVPGAIGIMLLTGIGGLIGYRQARAGRAVRSSGSARFSS